MFHVKHYGGHYPQDPSPPMSPPSPRGILTLVNSGNSSVNKFQEKISIVSERGWSKFIHG